MPSEPVPLAPRALMTWYLEAGVDETIGDAPVDRYAAAARAFAPLEASARPAPAQPAPVMTDRPQASLTPGPLMPEANKALQPAALAGNGKKDGLPPAGDEAVQSAYTLAEAAQSVAALRAALETFDGCALQKTATNLVFTDGSPEGQVVFVGEAPGAEEDRQGVPFVGPSGKLIDRMLESIGLDRTRVLITNTIFWRPPGNRSPTTQEIAICMPFLERLIELVDPKVLVAVGGPAASALLAQPQGITKLRGRWFSYETSRMVRPIPATAMFHPAYLLRSPAQKRDVWRDMLALRRKLDEES
ncbi:MAG: uracil-DNA glycosylase [Rhodospirillales bacterium]